MPAHNGELLKIVKPGGLLSLFREDGYLQEDIAIDFPELLQSSMDAEDRFCLRVIAQHLKNSTPQETGSQIRKSLRFHRFTGVLILAAR